MDKSLHLDSSSDFVQDSLGIQDFIALSGLFLLALSLKLIRLFDLDLIFDEAVLLLQAQESFAGIWNLCKTDNFPPLYSWMIKVWMSLGSGPVWFRLFGALMAALTVPAAYLLGREAGGRKVGWAVALLCALSATFMYYSQFVRMYNIQAFFACLSLYWFIKALKSRQWRYWVLMSVANLLGFYVYVFMTFIFLAQLLVIMYLYRLQIRGYFRPFVAHLIFFAGAGAWMLPTLQRYSQVQQAFWTPRLTGESFLNTMMHLSIGVDFHERYWLSLLLTLPLLLGLIFWLRFKPRRWEMNVIAFTAVFVFTIILSLSLGSRSFFHDRYLMYILPFILISALAGWFKLRIRLWKRLGVMLMVLSFGSSLVYYYLDYNRVHIFVGYLREAPYAEKGEGHGLSQTAAEVARRIGPDEVIIHYSEPYLRICSYYASLIYHDRALPEHIYSTHEIEQHNGRQYLKPGDWIRSLDQIESHPAGIWMITMNAPDTLLAKTPPIWVLQENLPMELSNAGYKPRDVINHFKVSAVHFRRDDGATAP